MKKKIPKFKNEDEEREFWSKADSSEYLNWKNAERVLFPSPEDIIREGRELRSVQMFIATTEKVRLREIALKKGKVWDKLTDAAQDQLIHEFLFPEAQSLKELGF
jgi:sucrose-6-phosphate hydrolase SacC (GH32 family)